ncbi:MAG: RNA polymerase sigma factor [Solirubrobacteraceae bacterium]
MVEPERARRLEALFAAHARAVRAYALRRIDPATADDIVSEVFVIAFRRLEEIPDPPLPWLLATARRVLANHRRAEGRRVALTGQLAALHAGASSEASIGTPELVRALARLRESDREILLLVAWEELGPGSAAAVLGCSRAAFAVRLHRARRRLAAAMVQTRRENDIALRPTEATK